MENKPQSYLSDSARKTEIQRAEEVLQKYKNVIGESTMDKREGFDQDYHRHEGLPERDHKTDVHDIHHHHHHKHEDPSWNKEKHLWSESQGIVPKDDYSRRNLESNFESEKWRDRQYDSKFDNRTTERTEGWSGREQQFSNQYQNESRFSDSTNRNYGGYSEQRPQDYSQNYTQSVMVNRPFDQHHTSEHQTREFPDQRFQGQTFQDRTFQDRDFRENRDTDTTRRAKSTNTKQKGGFFARLFRKKDKAPKTSDVGRTHTFPSSHQTSFEDRFSTKDDQYEIIHAAVKVQRMDNVRFSNTFQDEGLFTTLKIFRRSLLHRGLKEGSILSFLKRERIGLDDLVDFQTKSYIKDIAGLGARDNIRLEMVDNVSSLANTYEVRPTTYGFNHRMKGDFRDDTYAYDRNMHYDQDPSFRNTGFTEQKKHFEMPFGIGDFKGKGVLHDRDPVATVLKGVAGEIEHTVTGRRDEENPDRPGVMFKSPGEMAVIGSRPEYGDKGDYPARDYGVSGVGYSGRREGEFHDEHKPKLTDKIKGMLHKDKTHHDDDVYTTTEQKPKLTDKIMGVFHKDKTHDDVHTTHTTDEHYEGTRTNKPKLSDKIKGAVEGVKAAVKGEKYDPTGKERYLDEKGGFGPVGEYHGRDFGTGVGAGIGAGVGTGMSDYRREGEYYRKDEFISERPGYDIHRKEEYISERPGYDIHRKDEYVTGGYMGTREGDIHPNEHMEGTRATKPKLSDKIKGAVEGVKAAFKGEKYDPTGKERYLDEKGGFGPVGEYHGRDFGTGVGAGVGAGYIGRREGDFHDEHIHTTEEHKPKLMDKIKGMLHKDKTHDDVHTTHTTHENIEGTGATKPKLSDKVKGAVEGVKAAVKGEKYDPTGKERYLDEKGGFGPVGEYHGRDFGTGVGAGIGAGYIGRREGDFHDEHIHTTEEHKPKLTDKIKGMLHKDKTHDDIYPTHEHIEGTGATKPKLSDKVKGAVEGVKASVQGEKYDSFGKERYLDEKGGFGPVGEYHGRDFGTGVGAGIGAGYMGSDIHRKDDFISNKPVIGKESEFHRESDFHREGEFGSHKPGFIGKETDYHREGDFYRKDEFTKGGEYYPGQTKPKISDEVKGVVEGVKASVQGEKYDSFGKERYLDEKGGFGPVGTSHRGDFVDRSYGKEADITRKDLLQDKPFSGEKRIGETFNQPNIGSDPRYAGYVESKPEKFSERIVEKEQFMSSHLSKEHKDVLDKGIRHQSQEKDIGGDCGFDRERHVPYQ